LLYRDALAKVEQRIVDALPTTAESLISQAKVGNLAAATYLLNQILGRAASLTHAPAEDRQAPYTDDDFRIEQHERQENRELIRIINGSGASERT
jgi:hypothetical protein